MLSMALTLRDTLLPSPTSINDNECGICFTSFSKSKSYICSNCHSPFCLDCMQQYLNSKIEEGLVSNDILICPSVNRDCQLPLNVEIIKSILNEDMFLKYQQFLANEQLLGIRYCPVSSCSAIIQEPRFTNTRKVTCSNCNQVSCMQCGKKYHSVKYCRRKEDPNYRWFRSNDVRSCPSCYVRIEKTGGCSHMTCRQCTHEFCWTCLAAWEIGHSHSQRPQNTNKMIKHYLTIAIVTMALCAFMCWIVESVVTAVVCSVLTVGLVAIKMYYHYYVL